MQDTRFSVFISPAFEDLWKDRQAVQDAVLSEGDFPVQMVSFREASFAAFSFLRLVGTWPIELAATEYEKA